MFPPLTDAQIIAAREARDHANLSIKAANKRIVDAFKARPHRTPRDYEIDRHSLVTGLPVVLTLDGVGIALDYDRVLALQRKLPAKQWRVRVDALEVKDHPQLRVRYDSAKREHEGGCVIFYQLPAHQRAALDWDKLPKVDLDAAHERSA